MKFKVSSALLGVGLAIMAAATPALAEEWNREVIFQFNQPVEVPGHVLLPGSYVFQVADLSGERDVIQIFREGAKGESIVATVFAVPHYLLEPTEKPVVRFEERKKGSPEAIQSWFYPGDGTGFDFTYPQERMPKTAGNASPAQPAD